MNVWQGVVEGTSWAIKAPATGTLIRLISVPRDARVGDLVVVYERAPVVALVALAKIETCEDEDYLACDARLVANARRPMARKEVADDPILGRLGRRPVYRNANEGPLALEERERIAERLGLEAGLFEPGAGGAIEVFERVTEAMPDVPADEQRAFAVAAALENLEYDCKGRVPEYTDEDQAEIDAADAALDAMTDEEFEAGFVAQEEALRATNGKGLAKGWRESLAHAVTLETAREDEWKPSSERDARERVNRSIAVRRGQNQFRDELLSAYGGRCALTACDAVDALEAAHIVPYNGADANHVQNGLLLRADVHTLFDLGLIRLNPKNLTAELATGLKGTTYNELEGRTLRLPSARRDHPSLEALRRRYMRR